jgi:hypothetical protein
MAPLISSTNTRRLVKKNELLGESAILLLKNFPGRVESGHKRANQLQQPLAMNRWTHTGAGTL